MTTNTTYPDSAAPILRLTLGIMILAHGVVLKLFEYSLPGTAAFFESLGLPGLLAYAVFVAEAVGGTLLILGIATRWVSAALIPVLVGATWTHAGNGWMFSNSGGGWEYPAMLIVLAVIQILLGDGRYALRLRTLERDGDTAVAAAANRS